MKKLFLFFAMGSFTFSAAAEEKGAAPVALPAELVMISSSAGLPEGVDFSVKPMGYEYGVKLSFFVEGENFVRFEKDSLVADGWKFGSFPRIGKEGNQATFSISKKGNYLTKLTDIKVDGKVTMVTGNKVETVSEVANLKESQAMGPYKAQLKIEEGKNWGNGVTIEGSLDDIKSVTAKIDGKVVKSSGWSGFANKRTYHFKNIKDNTEITLEYWSNTDKKVVTFKK